LRFERETQLKLFILGLLVLVSPTLAAQSEEMTFGIVPQQAASKLVRLWSPVLDYVSRQSGLKIQFATAKDIPTFERHLDAGEYDFAYMNPYHFTVFNRHPGYQAVARARDKKIKGIIVVRKDSPIQSIEELDHMTLAFPAPAAFAASMLPRSELLARGLDFQSRYVSSHDSVYLAVAKGIYPAGGGVIRTFKNIAPEIRDQLKVLWTSRGFTPHAIAAHPDVSAEALSAVQSELVAMGQSDEGKALLKRLNIRGFERAENEDWDDVRSLQIDLPIDISGQ
jgi:phosphonate transport system substrate-binding protein